LGTFRIARIAIAIWATSADERVNHMITGVVLARNEELNIVECLNSLKPFVTELLLIDMESTDQTVALATPLVDEVLSHGLLANFDGARNIAIPRAKNDWLWFADADERIPAKVGTLVNDLIRQDGDKFEGIGISYKTFFCHRWIQHSGWWPGYNVPRVMKRGHFRFSEELHSGVKFLGREYRIPADSELSIDHLSYRSVEHYVDKFNKYTSTEAANLAKGGTNLDWQLGMRAMARDLWLYYEHHQGIKDGIHGWILAWLSGQYRWLSHAKLLDQPKSDATISAPPSLDAVLAVVRDEVARLRRHTPSLPLGVLLRSPVWDASGYAADGRTIAQGLAEGSSHAALRELRWNSTNCELAKGAAKTLKLLLRAEEPRSFVAVNDCIPTGCGPDPRASFNVLRTTFETDRIPANWKPWLDKYDEIWVHSEANRRAFRRSWVAPEKLRVIPGCIDTALFTPRGAKRSRPSELEDRFLFLSVLDWHLRKGWDVLLRAYAQEFAATDGVALLLKVTRSHGYTMDRVTQQANEVLCQVGHTLADRQDIRIDDELLGEPEMAKLYRSADAFVLASRGEGWGRPWMEAMACGLPTIGTQGGGNDDFMTETNSFLVPAEVTEVSTAAAEEIPTFAGHRWLEPDEDALRQSLREVFAKKGVSRATGKRAATYIRKFHSLDRMQSEVESAVRSIEARFQPSELAPSRDDQIRIAWEGEFFAGHSFANVNERLIEQFIEDQSLDLSIVRRLGSPVREAYTETERRIAQLFERPLPGGPQVTVRHSFPPNLNPPDRGKWVHIQYWEFGALPIDWYQPLRNRVDEIWAPSNYVRQVYENSGIPRDKIQVISLGVDTEVYTPDAPPLLLPTDKSFRFLFVGGTIPRKGFDRLWEAYLQEFTDEDDVCLVIKDLGSSTFYQPDSHRQQIQDALAAGGTPSIVYLDQYLTTGQLASLYTACDCFVAPYRGEGFGLPVLEAMACGLAPIVPQGGATDDFVTAQDAFLLPSVVRECDFPWRLRGIPTELQVDLGVLRKTMRQAFEDRELTNVKGAIGSERVRKHFTWRRTAAQMRERLAAIVEEDQSSCQLSTVGAPSIEDPRSPVNSPKISLCMIVRDNERTIRSCLESVRPWVDEMIVVDTGSTDQTPTIARELGATVYAFPWCDDFAAARNESLNRAAGEWLFWMDSDDTIDATNGARLRELVRDEVDPNTLGFVMQVQCPGPGPDGNLDVTVVDHVKLFRNRPDIRFEGRIHEQVLPAIRRVGGRLAWTDVFVVHSGYDHTAEGQKRKIDRDLRLLHLELKERPHHPFTLFNLGMTYSNIGQHDEAIGYLQQSIDRSQSAESHLAKTYALLAFSLKESGRLDQAQEVIERGLTLFPTDIELRFRRGVLLHATGKPQEAVAVYEEVLQAKSEPGFRSFDQGILGFKTRQNLAVALRDSGNLAGSQAEWERIVQELPRYRIGWRGLGEALLQQSKRQAVIELAEQLLKDDLLASEGHLLLAELAILEGDSGRTKLELEQAVAGAGEEIEPLQRLARFLFESGMFDEAYGALEELSRRCPDDASANHNLGTIELQRGNLGEAVERFGTAMRINGNSAQTHLYLGYTLTRLGHLEEAVALFQRALELDPHSEEARHALEEVSRPLQESSPGNQATIKRQE
jgi:glycosyltransferase involved in cell wall biosynthesis